MTETAFWGPDYTPEELPTFAPVVLERAASQLRQSTFGWFSGDVTFEPPSPALSSSGRFRCTLSIRDDTQRCRFELVVVEHEAIPYPCRMSVDAAGVTDVVIEDFPSLRDRLAEILSSAPVRVVVSNLIAHARMINQRKVDTHAQDRP